MKRPTQEEYLQARENKYMLSQWINMAKKEQEKLLDEIVAIRKNIETYQSAYDSACEVVEKYKIYEELESENKK